jgi:hypothetical protein
VSEQELTLIEAAEVAAQLGRPVKPITLRVWCEKGYMTCRKIGGGRGALWLVTRSASSAPWPPCPERAST